MNQKIDISDLELASALKMVGDALSKKIGEKGRKSSISMQEMRGSIDGEIDEFRRAVVSGDRTRVVEKMVSSSVECVLGVASVLAMMRREKEDASRAAGQFPKQ